MDFIGFQWFHEISWCDHDGHAHPELFGTVFSLGNERFRGVWKSLKKIIQYFQHYLVGLVSSRSLDVVTISKMLKIVENQGFWWIFKISWNLLVRSRRACPSRVAQDSFFPRKRTFQRRLKMFEIKFLLFSTLSSRFGIVEITRCGDNQQNVENCWKSMDLMDFDEFSWFHEIW